ncbi:hypothetical protein Q9L58_001113 [Maublancomyces gigas]|uniref:Bola-like protein n=1 Tax=Discina gigas TaxID=1032678 RepID=A0ABR3GVB0_9PEZI
MSRSTVSKLVTEFCYARPLLNNTRGGGGGATRIATLFPSFLHKPSPQSPRFSTSRSPALAPPDHLDHKELHIFNKLVTELSPSRLEVQDISAGCGTMYGIEIASRIFEGLPVMKQHRLVQNVLSEEIKGWHGVQLKTAIE